MALFSCSRLGNPADPQRHAHRPTDSLSLAFFSGNSKVLSGRQINHHTLSMRKTKAQRANSASDKLCDIRDGVFTSAEHSFGRMTFFKANCHSFFIPSFPRLHYYLEKHFKVFLSPSPFFSFHIFIFRKLFHLTSLS